MIAAFVMLALLGLSSGLRGEDSSTFWRRMALKWIVLSTILTVMAEVIADGLSLEPNLIVSAETFFIVALTCVLVSLPLYAIGRLGHRS